MKAGFEARFSAPRFEGPQIMSRGQFEKEANGWLNKVDKAQEALIREITAAAHEGKAVSAFDDRVKKLEGLRQRVWDLMLENANDSLRDPDSVMSVERDLLQSLEKPNYEQEMTESMRGFAEAEGRMQEENLQKIHRAEAEQIDRELKALVEERKALDKEEDRLFKLGNFDAIAHNTIDLKREEIDDMYDAFFDHLYRLARNLRGAIET